MTQTIECLIKRQNGSIIELGDSKYHFKANGAGDHVCDVDNEDHAAILLAIDTAYRPYVHSEEQGGASDETTVDLTGTVITTTADSDTNGETKQEEGEKQVPKDEAAERERLAAMHLERFGKKPHHMMGIKRLREELGLDEE